MKKKSYKIKDKTFIEFISQKEIESKIDEIATRINSDYIGENLVFVVIMRGAMFFAVDLIRRVTLNCEIEYISAKSYGNKMESTGNVDLCFPEFDVSGKHVIIIEDIIDTGITLKGIIEKFRKFNPASLELCSLLSKPANMKVNVSAKYVGIEIPPNFVIGYGLDYAGMGRQLNDIYIIDNENIDNSEEI
jgi:hypoxanthine phosphoribosyltransferase